MWIALMAAAALHSCAAVSGDQVLMSDLGRMDMRFASADANQSVGYAPVPGATRVFRPAELTRIASRNGIESSQRYYPICFVRPTQVLSAKEIEDAIRVWAPASATIEVLEPSKFPVPVGELTIPRPASAAEGATILHGFVSYGNHQKFPFWARVRLRIKQNLVVPAFDIEAGTEIRADQVRLELRENGIDSIQFASSLDQVVGHVAKRRMAAGNPALLTNLEESLPVRRGALVKVEVHDGGARLALDGRAEESGRTGEMVKVRNPSSGKDFTATVTGVNRVLVTSGGADIE